MLWNNLRERVRQDSRIDIYPKQIEVDKITDPNRIDYRVKYITDVLARANIKHHVNLEYLTRMIRFLYDHPDYHLIIPRYMGKTDIDKAMRYFKECFNVQ